MKDGARGFTLVELIVALGITLLLATMSLLAVRGLLALWQRAHGGGIGAIEAKLALDQLERDIHSAILRKDGTVWCDVRVVADAELAAHGWDLTGPRVKPGEASGRLLGDGGGSSIAGARFGRAGAWLRLVTSDYDGETGASRPVAISYQLARRAAGYALFREKMSAKATFENVMGVGFGAASPAALVAVENDDVLASNVVDFGVWVFTRDATGRRVRLFPTTNVAPVAAEFPGGGDPVVMEIMIRMLTDEGATRLQAFESGHVDVAPGSGGDEAWWALVEAHSRVYARTIELKARAW